MLPRCRGCNAQLTILKPKRGHSQWVCYGCRIRSKCEIHDEEGCWIWQGAGRGRYGIIRIRTGKASRTCNVHRAAYALWRGPITKSWAVLHTCEKTPLCCNPAHLFLKQQPSPLSSTGMDIAFGLDAAE